MFLDFDGTLVEIAPTPDAVRLLDVTRATLTRLQSSLGGALAIVTGREISAVDAMLAPFRCPVAGVHGMSRRDAEGRIHDKPADTELLDAAGRRLQRLAARHSGLLVERKSHAIAIHFRGNPALEAECAAAMEDIAALDDQVRLIKGKMVIEAHHKETNKGTAITEYMKEPPFFGRVPFFAGDDVTDEDAMQVVNDLGGISVKVGDGQSHARYSTADTASFLMWLEQTAALLERGTSIG